ncbi:unnamed protein product [Lathyrus sativus]|nr:unnamed protein product [Lathyrus sativus]
MDSGNSGSMQSSSCGDEIEEYDSRAESSNFSAFLNNPPPTTAAPGERNNHVISQFGNNNNNLINPQTQNHHHHNQMFDPLPNYYMESLQKQSSNPNSFLNLDMIWSKATARSEPNNTDLSTLLVPSSSSSSSSLQNHQAFLLSQFLGQTRENVASVPTTHQQHQYHQQQQHHSLPLESTSRGGSLANDHQDLINSSNNNNVGRNPKKRSRASRRAPTTVLTTDTTNFRAMVQEFTGIPAPPFPSPFPRTRLDLFGSSVASRSMSNHMDPPPPPPPPYLLRPFAQKIQPFSPLIQSSSSIMENLASNNPTNSASINYHLSQQNNHPLMQHNQILGFQSISQTPTKYPHGTQQPSLETTPNVDSRMKIGTVFDELGLSHAQAHVNNSNNNNVNIGILHNNMVTTTTTTSSDAVNNSNENQWSQRTIAGVEKGQECVVVSTRGEATVESWINCSSSD